MGNLNDIFRREGKRADRIKSIREDEEKKAATVFYGVGSIVASLVSVAFTILALVLLNSAEGDGLKGIALILPIVILIVCPVITLFWGLRNAVTQTRMNRRAVTYIAWTLFIASLAATVILAIMFFGKL